MSRLLVAAALLVLLGSSLPAAAFAGESRVAEADRPTLELERLLAELAGDALAEPVVTLHGKGRLSIAFPLSEAGRARFVASDRAAKTLVTLANGHMVGSPDFFDTLVNAVFSVVGQEYTWWWCVMNLTSNDLERKTTNTVKGPGLNFRQSENISYESDALECWFEDFDVVFPELGIYTHKTKVTKGGAAVKTRALAVPQ